MASLHLAKEIFNLIYPVGSVYISTNATNPTNLFGGTWVAINSRFLIGVGTATGEGGEKYDFKLGNTGGEYSHKLSEGEMPMHRHHIATDPNGSNDNPNYIDPIGWYAVSTYTDLPYSFRKGTGSGWVGRTSNSGSGYAHNNLPPFLVVHMWKRTA